MADFQLPLPNMFDERRKYTFYAIVNTVTGKRYVGMTIDYKGRIHKHRNDLKLNKHHSEYLQYSYNKHGEQAFKFEIIERGMFTDEQAESREIYWIAEYDSYENGYNMSEGGIVPNRTPATWNGIQYGSQSECAIALGISLSALRSRLSYGYQSDDEMVGMGNYRNEPVAWNDSIYPSLAIAANELGIARDTLAWRLKQGYTRDSEVPLRGTHSSLEFEWENITYSSINEAERQTGIDNRLLGKWKARGYTCLADVPKMGWHVKRPVEWDGAIYPSRQEAASAIGVDIKTLHRWLKKGYKSFGDLSGREQMHYTHKK